ncbi:hypothetical protein TNCV_2663611 [Trichonephila clavipes]|nr:hypothetical protein TNCV_2663611 [Trichonephila clavipes]
MNAIRIEKFGSERVLELKSVEIPKPTVYTVVVKVIAAGCESSGYLHSFWRTAKAGSDVVQSGRPIFDDFSNSCGRISAITRRMLSSKWSSVCGLSAQTNDFT